MELRFITFMLSKERYALDLGLVREVVSGPQLTKIPSAVQFVPWICDLRGHVIPVVDLRKYLELDWDSDAAEEMIVLSKGNRMIAILVDSTDEMLAVSESEYEETRSGNIKGTLRLSNRIIPVLDVDPLFEHGKVIEERVEHEEASSSERLLTVFKVKGHPYAFLTEQVREITKYTAPFHMPDTPDHVLGLIRIREDLMPLIDLAGILGLGRTESPETCTLLVTVIKERLAAFLVSEVDGMFAISEDVLKARGDFGEKTLAVADLEGKLVTVLNVDKLVDEKILGFSKKAELKEEEKASDEVQILLFKLSEQDFGLPTEHVEEVAKTLKAKTLPNAPQYVEGVVRLRDEVMPLIDLRKRFDFPTETESTNMIIVELESFRFALGVDRVEGIVSVSSTSISETGNGSVGTRKVAKLKTGELIPLIEIEDVIEMKELKQLTPSPC